MPEAIAQNHYARGSRNIVLAREAATQDGLYSEQGEKIRAYLSAAVQPNRLHTGGKVAVTQMVVIASRVLKAAVLIAPGEKRCSWDHGRIKTRCVLRYPDQARGIAIRQWLQQHGMNQTEDGCSAANANRKRQNAGSRKSYVPLEHTSCKAQIGDERVQYR
jgi:hypothetical protein